jgi:hypothetical protein
VVALKAYAADCRVFGTVDLGDRRMSDVLNATPEIRVAGARLESLESDQVVEVPELTIGRDELCVVEAAGSEGDPTRRLRTRTTRVAVDVGPYRVEGSIHGTAASDPLAAIVRRSTWVPLTDAVIAHRRVGPDPTAAVTTLIVNRELATTFQEIEESLAALPWETWERPTPVHGGGADMTSMYADEPREDPDENDPPHAADPVV